MDGSRIIFRGKNAFIIKSSANALQGSVNMKDRTISIIYFSATNVTCTYAEVIREQIKDQGWDVRMLNVTSFKSRKKTRLEGDKFIFGFPVYGDYAPSVINSWLKNLHGEGRRCAMFFTYGGRTTGYAHYHTKKLLKNVGFQVLFSAEFLGRHSFNLAGWTILQDRPNDRDFVVAREFACLATDRFSQKYPPHFNLQKPFGYYHSIKVNSEVRKRTQRGFAQPIRRTEDCSMCHVCEEECPTEAFNADTGLSDINECIECLRCVYVCPDHVIECDPKMKDDFKAFLDNFDLNDEMLNAKQSKIINESWQAAA
jgi:NAD-dependent dihydropyrimidine dehydrogenase PreA subunit/flavodoxin